MEVSPSEDAAIPGECTNPEPRGGAAYYRHRLYIQTYHAHHVVAHGSTLFHAENVRLVAKILERILKMAGFYARGNRNAKAVRVKRHRVSLDRLPEAFHGFTILQLSDLHLDIEPEIGAKVASLVRDLDYDCCIVTGDIRGNLGQGYDDAVRLMKELMPNLRGPVYGVLGNHDLFEMVEPLEAAGMRFLLNENVSFSRDGAALYLAGVDDAHFFEADDFFRAYAGIPDDAVAIVLSHSPETYRKAAGCGFDLMLSGHTHGGQICLPGGIAVIRNGRCARRFARGPWKQDHLKGYTSPGAGTCGVAVRFFCPPEITLHTLECAGAS